MKKKIMLPKFKDEDAEREFWDSFDLSEYAEVGDFERVVFPNLKPTTHSISLRLPEYTLARLKEKANAMDVPYQSLIKQYIEQGLTK
jgi:predicted DNA binding CopG/RHH family protein